MDHLFLHCFVAFDLWARVLKEMGVSWACPQHCKNIFQFEGGFWGQGKIRKKLRNATIRRFVGHYGLREIAEFLNIKKAAWSFYGRVKFWVALWVFKTKEFIRIFVFRFN